MFTEPSITPDKRHSRYSPRIRHAQQALFLKTLENTGNEGMACKEAGVTIRTIQRWALSSESFGKKREEAQQLGNLWIRYQLEHQGDTMLFKCKTAADFAKTQIYRMFRMKYLDHGYRENANVNVQVGGPMSTVFEKVVVIEGNGTPTTGLLSHEQPKK